MKKLLYVSFGNASTPGRGVTKKINSQLKAFQRAGMETVFISGYNDRLAAYHGNAEVEPEIVKLGGGTRSQLAQWISEHASEYDCAYIRFQFFDFYFQRMLKSLKKNNVKIVVEIPTYPYIGELKAQGLKGKPKIVIDKLFQNVCKKYIDRFVSPAYEGEILGKESLPMKNGIDMEGIKSRCPKPQKEDTVNLLAVASMSPWHAFERIILGLSEYFSSNPSRDVHLELVGDGVELPRYRNMVQELGLDDKVTFRGRLSGDALDKTYDDADIGICSLGIHKLGIARSNTLKTLEYLAKGLPIICEESEAGIGVDNAFRMNVASEDTPIRIPEIICFYDSIYRNRPEEVIESVRKVCNEECSTDAAIRDIIQFFLK